MIEFHESSPLRLHPETPSKRTRHLQLSVRHHGDQAVAYPHLETMSRDHVVTLASSVLQPKLIPHESLSDVRPSQTTVRPLSGETTYLLTSEERHRRKMPPIDFPIGTKGCHFETSTNG